MGDDEVQQPLDERHLEDLVERVRTSPFHRWAGMELVSVGDGKAEVSLQLGDHHFNPQRIVHGDVIAAIADTSIGLALRSMLRPGMTHRTAPLNVHFLAKAEVDRIIARGRSLHLGQRMGYGETEVSTREDGSWPGPPPPSSSFRAPGAF